LTFLTSRSFPIGCFTGQARPVITGAGNQAKGSLVFLQEELDFRTELY
jgi:hypothetical protein